LPADDALIVDPAKFNASVGGDPKRYAYAFQE